MTARPFPLNNNRPKYGNKRVERNGRSFASLKEANRYAQLELLQRAGEIRELRAQVRFPLRVNDALVTTYVADATYDEKQPDGSWRFVVEDTKGYRTPEYVLKAKLFAALNGFAIREV